MPNISISFDTDQTTNDRLNAVTRQRSGVNQRRTNMDGLLNLVAGIDSGLYDLTRASVAIGERAAGSIVFTGLPTAAQTCVINGVTITARASGAVANEFNIGADGPATAIALAAAINASVTGGLAGIVTADISVAGTVRIRANFGGRVGLGYTVSTGLTNTTANVFALSPAETAYVQFT
jgi:hypothetical protein